MNDRAMEEVERVGWRSRDKKQSGDGQRSNGKERAQKPVKAETVFLHMSKTR